MDNLSISPQTFLSKLVSQGARITVTPQYQRKCLDEGFTPDSSLTSITPTLLFDNASLPKHLQPLAYTAIRSYDLFQALNHYDYFRLVRFEDTETHQYLVFCGLYRFVKEKTTARIIFQRLSLSLDTPHKPTRWVSTSFIPDIMLPLGGDWMKETFHDIGVFVVKQWLKDSQKLGIKTITYKESLDDETYHREQNDKRLPMSFEPLAVNLDEVAKKAANRLFFMEGEHFRQASRCLPKYLWHFVDREKYSIWRKIHGPSGVQFKHIHRFCCLDIDVQQYQQHAAWLPWLMRLTFKEYIEPQLFSYNTLLPLLKKSYDDTLTKSTMRKVDKLPLSLKKWCIEKGVTDIVDSLLLLNRYPASVQVLCLEACQYLFPTPLTPAVSHCLRQWAVHHQSMIKSVKPRKQKAQWQRAIAQLKDVLHWQSNLLPQIHKNQTWTTLLAGHDAWIEEMNRRSQEEEKATLALHWSPAQWTLNHSDSTTLIQELTDGQALLNEGKEQSHCIFSYVDDCANGRYRVFSLRHNNERATLGVHQDFVSHRVEYDQLRGANNTTSSPAMDQLAMKLIEAINSSQLEQKEPITLTCEG